MASTKTIVVTDGVATSIDLMNEFGYEVLTTGDITNTTGTNADIDAALSIDLTEANVSGAGSAECDGEYLPDGTFSAGRLVYFRVGGDMVNDKILWNGSIWIIGSNATGDCYTSTDDVADPWLVSTWSVSDGAGPVPTVTQAIGTVAEQVDLLGIVKADKSGVGLVSVNKGVSGPQAMIIYEVTTSGGVATTGDISADFSNVVGAWAVVTGGSANALMRETAFATTGVAYDISVLAAAVVAVVPSAGIADGTPVRIVVVGTPV